MEKEVIYNAVVNNTTIPAKFGGNQYNVCELFTLNLDTLDGLYRSNNELLSKMNQNSLLNRNSMSNVINDRIALIEVVFKIKKAAQEAAEAKKALLKAKKERLMLLTKAKEEKEIQAISNMSLEDIEKELALIE